MSTARTPWGISVTRGFVVGPYVRSVIIPLVWLLGAGGAGAQTVALQDTVYRLSEVLVEADRLSRVEDLKNRPSFVTILPMEEVSRRVSSSAEYLGRTVGFNVKSTGGYGAYSTASIRGSSAKQVTVLVDGVPLNQAQSGLVNLADLPVSSIARIEVYRGFGAFDLSGSTIGGVINLVTAEPSRDGRGRLSASYGSFSTQQYRASYAFSWSDWDVLAVGSAVSTEGDFEFLDDNGTPYTTADDEVTERINNHLEERDALIKLSRPLGSGTIVVTNQLYHRRQGLPGYGAYQSPTEALTKTHDLFHVTWDRAPTPAFPLRLSLGLFSLYQVDKFEDRRAKTGTAKPDVTNRAVSLGGNVRWRFALPEYRQSLRGMLQVRRESFRPEEFLTETVEGNRQSRVSTVVTLEDEIEILQGHLRLIPSGRWERFTDDTRGVAPGAVDFLYMRGIEDTTLAHDQTLGTVGAIANIAAGVTLKGNYGRYYRVPSLMELFGYRGVVLPSPTLKPESGLNRDLGVVWERTFGAGSFLSLEYVYFWSDVEDLIMYLYPTRQAAKAVNIDQAEIEGYEISLACGRLFGLSFSGNLTRLRAINTGPVTYTQDKYLPDRPERSAFARLEWHGGRWCVFGELDYIDGNYWNAYNGVAPNNEGPYRVRRLYTAGLTVPVGLPRTEFTFEMKNITDERVEDVMGYPRPGRSVYGTFALSL